MDVYIFEGFQKGSRRSPVSVPEGFQKGSCKRPGRVLVSGPYRKAKSSVSVPGGLGQVPQKGRGLFETSHIYSYICIYRRTDASRAAWVPQGTCSCLVCHPVFFLCVPEFCNTGFSFCFFFFSGSL